MQTISADDLKKLAEQRLRDLENQRKRAAKLRESKAASGEVRFSIYVPRELLPVVKTAVQNALADARKNVTQTVTANATAHDGSANDAAERDAVTSRSDETGATGDKVVGRVKTGGKAAQKAVPGSFRGTASYGGHSYTAPGGELLRDGKPTGVTLTRAGKAWSARLPDGRMIEIEGGKRGTTLSAAVHAIHGSYAEADIIAAQAAHLRNL